MTNVERAFIHQLAQTMGLKSKSDGKGEDRFLTVTKKGTYDHYFFVNSFYFSSSAVCQH